MSKVMFTEEQFSAIQTVENIRTDEKTGKPVTWVNFNLKDFIKPIMAEIAKANGYHVPESGIAFNIRSYRGDVSAGFVKTAAPVSEALPKASGNLSTEDMETAQGWSDALKAGAVTVESMKETLEGYETVLLEALRLYGAGKAPKAPGIAKAPKAPKAKAS